MADDTFDVRGLESAKEALEAMRGASRQTAEHMQDWNVAINQWAKARAELDKYGKMELFDEKLLKDVEKLTNQLGRKIVSMGGDVDKLIRHQEKHKKILASELEYMKGMAREGDKLEKSEARKTSAFKKHAQQVSSYAQNMAGVQLTLLGIIAKIIEINDISRKFTGTSKQMVSQWEEGEQPWHRMTKDGKKLNEHLQAAWGSSYGIAKNFHISNEAAMNYSTSLARAGMEKKDLLKLSSKIMATEFVTGKSAQQQVADIGALVTNFKLTGEAADYYLDTVWKTTKTIPYLSPQEATNDWKELIDKTKVYNTDLLGTLALYNTLMRKDLAKELGLGDAPRIIRKDIVSTVAGFSKELEDGWKAALGKGATAAAKILEFEKLLPTEQFARMAEFITEKTAGFTGETQEIAVRQLLKQFGFTAKETRKVLAEAFAGGGLTPNKLSELVVETGKSRKAMKVTEKTAAENRKKMIEQGLSIANNLASNMKKLQDWVERNLMGPINDLIKAIKELGVIFKAKTWEEMVKGLKDLDDIWKKGALSDTMKEAAEAVRREVQTKLGGPGHVKEVRAAVPRSIFEAVKSLPAVKERGAALKTAFGPASGMKPYSVAAAEALTMVGPTQLGRASELARQGYIKEAVDIVKGVLAKEYTQSRLVYIKPMHAHYEDLKPIGAPSWSETPLGKTAAMTR